MDYSTMFIEGGFTALCLVILLIGTPLLWPVPFFGVLRLRVPAALSVGIVQLALTLGWLGAHWELGYAESVATHSHAALLARNVGTSLVETLYPLSASALTAAWLAVGFASSMAISASIGVGGTRRPTPLSAIGALPLGLLACVCAIAGTWMGALFGLIAAASIGLASTQASDSEADNQRLVAARASVGFCGVLAVLLVLFADLSATTAGAIQGARREFDTALTLHLRHFVLMAAALVGCLSTAVVCAPLARQLPTRRTLFSALSVLMVLTPNGVFAAGYAWRVHGLKHSVDAPQRVAAELDAQGISPPRVTFVPGGHVVERQRLTFGEQVTFEGQPVHPESFDPGGPAQPPGYRIPEYVNIQASGDMELGRLLPFAATLSKYTVGWHVDTDEGLLGTTVTLRTQAEPLKDNLGIPTRFRPAELVILLAEKHGTRWRLAREIDSELFVVEGDDLRAMLQDLDRVDELHIQFRPTDTVQDLMDLASITHDPSGREPFGPRHIELVWRVDAELIR